MSFQRANTALVAVFKVEEPRHIVIEEKEQSSVIDNLREVFGRADRSGTMNRPLSDLRIIAVEQYGAGPFGSVHLADLGAEVIKIEDPRVGGDVGRYVPPYHEEEDSLFFETFNRNKKSVSLDLRHERATEVFHDIVRNVDGVYSNLRGDQPLKLGLTYEQLKAFHATHYHPSNAVFMTYGDIGAAEHQARFEKGALGQFQALDMHIGVPDEQRYSAPVQVEDHYALDGEEDTADKTHIVLGWLLDRIG